MKNLLTVFLIITLVLVSWKEEPKKENLSIDNSEFATLLKYYNEGKLKLNPIEATFIGDSCFDDAFPNVLSDTYQQEYDTFYSTYASKLENFKDANLTESEQMSKAVMAWDCELVLAQASFRKDMYMHRSNVEC